MSKFLIYACNPCTVGYHYVWEVKARSKKEAQAKVKALEEKDWASVPLSEDSDANTNEVKCVDAWEDCCDCNGLEFWDLKRGND